MTELSATGTPMMVLTGTANPALAERIAEELDQPLCEVTIKRFADGEIFVRIDRNARGRDVFIVQPTVTPGDSILELLLLIDAATGKTEQFPMPYPPGGDGPFDRQWVGSLFFGRAEQGAVGSRGQRHGGEQPHVVVEVGHASRAGRVALGRVYHGRRWRPSRPRGARGFPDRRQEPFLPHR